MNYCEAIKGKLKRIYCYRQVLWDMAVTQLKTKYNTSALGIYWMVINPILIMLSITFVFVSVFQVKIDNFSLFVLLGILPWIFLSNSLSESASSILNKQQLLRQYNVPLEIIPMSMILSHFINFVIGWIIIYLFSVLLNFKILFLLPLLVIGILLNLAFIVGFGLSISIFNIFYRDVSKLLEVSLMIWFWLTPIFYSPEMVPQKFNLIVNLNPMTHYVVFYREIIFSNRLPGILTLSNVFLWAFLSLFFGLLSFCRFEAHVLKNI